MVDLDAIRLRCGRWDNATIHGRGNAVAWAEQLRHDCGELLAEVERLRAFALEARALAYSGDCDACGATDMLLDLVDQYGVDNG